MGQIIIEKNENGLGTILLNRPEALNSLTFDMIEAMKGALEKWQDDEAVKVVFIGSTTERALCAGGDMKMMYEAKMAEKNMDDVHRFFHLEYVLDEMVHTYEKPIVAILNGIVMGGGVGFTYGADYKIVTDQTKWAMPETKISFFPDVAASYFLNLAPGKTGRYVALTGETLAASDVIFLKAANVYVKTDDLDALINGLHETNWHEENIEETLLSIMNRHRSPIDETGKIERNLDKINVHFAHDTVEEIFASLERDESDFAKETLNTLKSLSPISLKVTLELMKRGETMSLKESFQTDLIVAKRFLEIDDFYEGVRSVLVDKDRDPKYDYRSIEEVPDDFVQSFFNK